MMSSLNTQARIAQLVLLCTRGLRYNKKGGLIGGRKKRLPFNWRDVNYNPAQIPSAWIPKDWAERQKIDYERECELAKYIPGYKAKVPNHLRDDYQEEPLYVFDRQSSLVEGLKQAMYVTKSIITEKGLPKKISDHASVACYQGQDDKAIQVFRHAHLFDIDPKLVVKDQKHKFSKLDNLRIFPSLERYCPLIMRELVRLCEIRSYQLSESFHSRILVENIISTSCFRRVCPDLLNDATSIPTWEEQWKMLLESSADMQLQSDQPLQPFADAKAIDVTNSIPLHSIYPTLPIVDVKKTNNYTFHTKTGIPTQFPKPYLHTMVLFNKTQESPNVLYGKMLLQLHASLYSRAIEICGPEPQDLSEPLTGQCIASDGRVFQFMCLQLNTTKMDCDKGIKNMVWVDNEAIKNELYNVDDSMTPFAMYNKCSHTTWESPEYYTDYNPDVFKLLQGFWMNGVL